MNEAGQQYRQEWAAKTGRPTSEVYVPDALRDPVVRPLAIGDRIRILERNHFMAEVEPGDLLTVRMVGTFGEFETDAPRLRNPDYSWGFEMAGEGTGWERA